MFTVLVFYEYRILNVTKQTYCMIEEHKFLKWSNIFENSNVLKIITSYCIPKYSCIYACCTTLISS